MQDLAKAIALLRYSLVLLHHQPPHPLISVNLTKPYQNCVMKNNFVVIHYQIITKNDICVDDILKNSSDYFSHIIPLVVLIPYHIFKTNLKTSSRSIKYWLINHQSKYLKPEVEDMKLLWGTERRINKVSNGKNVPQIKITEVVLAHCSISNNQYHYDSGVLFIFVSNKSTSQLLNISPTNHIFLETLHSEFSKLNMIY